METKVCRKCGRELPIGKFHKCKDMKDGHKNICKTCKSIEAKEWWKKKRLAQQEEPLNEAKASSAIKTKTCPKCGQELPVTSFYIDRKTKSGYSCYCKKCQTVATHNSGKKRVEKVKSLRITEFDSKDMLAELKTRMPIWKLIKQIIFN